jgi:hypothetical protein
MSRNWGQNTSIMIDKESIILFKNWVNEDSLFIDEYTDTYMHRVHIGLGESEYYRVPPQLTGLFSLVDFEDKEHYSFCQGQLAINKANTIRFEPIPVKLFKVITFAYFNYEQHQNNLLSAISFASFHYRNITDDEIPFINSLIAIPMILNGSGKIKDEKLLKASVLVNIVNDTHVRIESIEMLFGKHVRTIVEILAYISRCGDKSAEVLLKKLSDASDGAKKILLAILLTNLKYLTTLDGKERKIHFEWSDKKAEVCESASIDLYHLYRVERSKFG